MKEKIFIDEGIQDLVSALNQIDGVTTQNSCEGHSRTKAYVNFYSPKEMAIELMKTSVKERGIEFRLLLTWQKERIGEVRNHQIGLHYGWSGKTLAQMQAELIDKFAQNGWLTQTESPFEIRNKTGELWPPDDWIPDFSQSRVPMTLAKFEHLKKYLAEKYQQHFKEEIITANSHIPHDFWTAWRPALTLTGNEISGTFYYEFFGETSRKDQVLDVRWREKRLLVKLSWLSRLPPIGPREHLLTCLDDLDAEGIPFKSEAEDLIRELFAS